jgi:hypothetical protein
VVGNQAKLQPDLRQGLSAQRQLHWLPNGFARLQAIRQASRKHPFRRAAMTGDRLVAVVLYLVRSLFFSCVNLIAALLTARHRTSRGPSEGDRTASLEPKELAKAPSNSLNYWQLFGKAKEIA